jgi:hypothetical protein
MKLYNSDKFRFIAGFIFIVIIYSWNYLYFIEYKDALLLPKITMHFLSFTITIVVYFIGTFHLGQLKDTWMSSLWHLVHISGLIIMISLGLVNLFIIELNVNLKHLVFTIQEILISPVLYVAMGLLNKTLNK